MNISCYILSFMKSKLILSLGFFLGLILISNLITIHAQEATPTPTQDKKVTTQTFIKYDLAYPGILPDHPLYKLKVLRDKISVGLISDPQRKIDFYLLQTDKGILAAAMLIDKKKIALAKETALKAEHNFTLITYQLWTLDEKPNDAFFDKLKTASFKHQEVLNSLIKRVSSSEAKTFQTVIDFSKRNWQTIEEYKKQYDNPISL